MLAIRTSNELSNIYGQPPSNGKSVKLSRGYIVYLEMFSGNGIFARVFYKDFDDEIPDQTTFEEMVIQKKGLPNLAPTKGEFPELFANRVSAVHFGWKSCHVSYILNSTFAEFLAPDQAHPNIQPIVFRRNKIVIDAQGVPQEYKYQPNHSFFNLGFHKPAAHAGVSILRFDNLMKIDEEGSELGEPPVDDSARFAKRFDYCMDIHIRVAQTSTQGVSGPDGTNADAAIANLADAITIVFDPPQTNGGGDGPP